MAPDGRWWIGDRGGSNELSEPGALWSGSSFGGPPEKLASGGVRCLAHRATDDTLFACRRSEFGTVSASGEFVRRMSFTDIDRFVSCPGEDLAQSCKEQLCKNWCGPLHFPEAGLCDAYDDESPLCGVPARSYGRPTAPGASTPVSTTPASVPGGEMGAASPSPNLASATAAASNPRETSTCAMRAAEPASAAAAARAGVLLSAAALLCSARRRARRA